MQNFVRFNAIKSEIELSEKFWEKRKIFVQFHQLETEIGLFQKFRKKNVTQAPLVERFLPKVYSH